MAGTELDSNFASSQIGETTGAEDLSRLGPGAEPLGNRRYERFCCLVVAGRPIVHAYGEAGFQADSGAATRLMARPEIAARIDHLTNEWRIGLIQGTKEVEFAYDAAQIDKSFVLSRLATIAERCMQAQPVRNRYGELDGVWQFDAPGANRSLELLGKHLGMWSDRQRPGYDREISGMSDNELDDLSRRLGTLAGVEVDLELAGHERAAKYRKVKQIVGARVRGKMVTEDSSAETGVDPMIFQQNGLKTDDSSEVLQLGAEDSSECARETEGFVSGEEPRAVPELERGPDLLSEIQTEAALGADCDTASADAISLSESSDSSSDG